MPTLNLGRVGFVNKGTWLVSTAYKINDTVSYLGGIYACLIANTGQVPISGGSVYWQEWVANDSVHKSGDETINGIKTFTSSPVIPTPALGNNSTNAASTAFVIAEIPNQIHSATSKITPVDADELPISDSAASFGLKKITVANLKSKVIAEIAQQFRLTLTSGIPVTTSNVTAATTLYLTPYNGNSISIYNGTSWDVINSSQISIAVPASTSQMYDVFVYNNSGTPTLELTAWTNDTTRATALTYQDGVLVKTGALTRRYIGSFRTTAVSGQTEDSLTKRYVWNYYNRVTRPMYVTDATASWVYTTSTWRQANGSTANQIDFVIGVSEDIVTAFASHCLGNTGTAGLMQTGIGLDTTTSPSNLISTNGSTAGTTMLGTPTAQYESLIPAGRHFLAWLEWSTAVGTTTWQTNTGIKVGLQGGILG